MNSFSKKAAIVAVAGMTLIGTTPGQAVIDATSAGATMLYETVLGLVAPEYLLHLKAQELRTANRRLSEARSACEQSKTVLPPMRAQREQAEQAVAQQKRLVDMLQDGLKETDSEEVFLRDGSSLPRSQAVAQLREHAQHLRELHLKLELASRTLTSAQSRQQNAEKLVKTLDEKLAMARNDLLIAVANVKGERARELIEGKSDGFSIVASTDDRINAYLEGLERP